VPDDVDFFNLPNPSSRIMALGSTQPLTEMSTRHLLGGKKQPDVGLTTLPPSVSRMAENIGASTSCNPKGLHGLYSGNSTFTFFNYGVASHELPMQGVENNFLSWKNDQLSTGL
jgi:hypothetical protein